MASAITAEGLGKRYALKHLDTSHSYSTFRDVLVDGVKNLGRSLVRRRVAVTDTEEFWALRDLDFDIRQGEKIGIIGRNGAGKSTLLKILSRIIEPTAGRVRIRGRLASLLEVGTGFHPELTGKENIYFNGAILGMSRAEVRARFDEIVSFAGVEKFLDTPVKYYSSGMYVRLGFAVAAHIDPEILIVDEVLAVGDVQFQKKCMGKIEEIGRAGRTVLFVSHNMSAVLQLTERSLVMDRGRLAGFIATGDAVALYLKLNGEAGQVARNQPGFVPWLRVRQFMLERPNAMPRFNEAVHFRLSLELEQAMSDAMMTMVLSNTIGAQLVISRALLGDLPAGIHGFSLELGEHRLLPGTYSVLLVLRQGDNLVFRKEQLISFDLLLEDDGRDPALSTLVIHHNDQRGCYCPLVVSPVEAAWLET